MIRMSRDNAPSMEVLSALTRLCGCSSCSGMLVQHLLTASGVAGRGQQAAGSQ